MSRSHRGLDADSTLSNPEFQGERPGAALDSMPQQPNFGRYRLLRVLGHGTTGIVFEAHDPSLDRRVALKVPLPGTKELHTIRRQREAQALARLSHPNVVGIYETGTVRGQRFIAMELIEGMTLKHWQSQPRPWRSVLDVYLAAGRGLAAIHAAGLVHRDFKPDNCIVDSTGHVCIVDFGLAADSHYLSERFKNYPSIPPASTNGLSPGDLFSERITRPGAIVGTLAYMPLVQRQGAVWDAHADQYSFCTSMWEALHRKSNPSPSLASVAHSGPHDSPSRRRIPRVLHGVVMRGMDEEPSRRWDSVEALLKELERCRRFRSRWSCATAMLVTNFVTAMVTATLAMS